MLLVFGRSADDTDGVCGMVTGPLAETPNADEASPPPPVAEAVGMTIAATATGAARAPAIAPYFRFLRMGPLLGGFVRGERRARAMGRVVSARDRYGGAERHLGELVQRVGRHAYAAVR